MTASAHPAAGKAAWQTTDLSRVAGYSNSPLTEAGCVSARWCAVADQEGDLLWSADPDAPAARWTAVSLPPGISALACPAAGECVGISGTGAVDDPPARIWSTTDATGGARRWRSFVPKRGGHHLILTGITCPGRRLCVASGEEGSVEQSTDYGADLLTSARPTAGADAWKVVHKDGFYLEQDLAAGVSCPSVRWCGLLGFRSGDEGRSAILTSSVPRGGPQDWKLSRTPSLDTPLVCAARSLCLANRTTLHGGFLTVSRNPAGGPHTWRTVKPPADPDSGVPLQIDGCASATLCIASGFPSTLFVSRTPGGPARSWQPIRLGIGSTPLTGISCPDPGLCVVADAAHRLLVASDPGSGDWSITHTDSQALGPISCPSQTFCAVITATELLTSSEPTGGQWSPRPLTGSGQDVRPDSLACLATGTCLVGDDEGGVTISPALGNPVTSTLSPTACSPGEHGEPECTSDPITGVACVPGGFCAATDQQAGVFWTTPAAGQSTWVRSGTAIPSQYLDLAARATLTCIDASTCVIANGDVVGVTHDASDPAPQWTVSHLPAAAAEPVTASGLSCVSSQLCVIVDSSGGLAFDGDPSTGTWSTTQLEPGIGRYPYSGNPSAPALTGVSCGLDDACVAIDGTGHVTSGTIPPSRSSTKARDRMRR